MGTASLILLYVKNGRIKLLVQQRAFSLTHGGGRLALPGGHIKKGEEPLVAALREGQEESGLPLMSRYGPRGGSKSYKTVIDSRNGHYDVIIVSESEWDLDKTFPQSPSETARGFVRFSSRHGYVDLGCLLRLQGIDRHDGRFCPMWHQTRKSVHKLITWIGQNTHPIMDQYKHYCSLPRPLGSLRVDWVDKKDWEQHRASHV